MKELKWQDITFALIMADSLLARDNKRKSLTGILKSCAGETGMKELKRQDVNFALVVADSLLARDKLDRALKSGRERLKEKHVSGLKTDDLVFCDD